MSFLAASGMPWIAATRIVLSWRCILIEILISVAVVSSLGCTDRPSPPLEKPSTVPHATRYPKLGVEASDSGLAAVEITLLRTARRGHYPTYKIILRGDGSGLYSGRDFVIVQGDRLLHVDLEVLRTLLDRFEALDFFEVDHRDDWITEDAPAEVVTLTYAGRTRTIKNYGAGGGDWESPEDSRFHSRMSDIAKLIDDSSLAVQLVGTKSDRDALFASDR